MFNNTLWFTTLVLLFLASNPSTKGLSVPLIPSLSPQSPFYNAILEANNIVPTTTNITLDRNHYMNWFVSKISVPHNEKSQIYYDKGTNTHLMIMHLGYPIQEVYGIFDTGSGLTWFQCEERAGESSFKYFNQSDSFTYSVIECKDKEKCKTNGFIKGCYGFGSDCEFVIAYEDGTNASGVVATEHATFKWPEEILVLFRFGCSRRNSDNMVGIIGASNSEYSLPKQLYHDDPKFSYCIPSDRSIYSLVIFGPDANLKGQPIKMLSNPYREYYYLPVLGIKVNGERIDLPPFVFKMSRYGSRGFVIDSGSLLTHLTWDAFVALKSKVEQILGPSSKFGIFDICYDSKIFEGWRPLKARPTIGIDFEDYYYEIDMYNVWQKMPNSDNLDCLLILGKQSYLSILGSWQLQDVNIGHDPNNKLLYLQKTTCPIG